MAIHDLLLTFSVFLVPAATGRAASAPAAAAAATPAWATDAAAAPAPREPAGAREPVALSAASAPAGSPSASPGEGQDSPQRPSEAAVEAGSVPAPPDGTPGPSTPGPGAPQDLWNDPTFQKEFLGSYGFDAEIEPRVSAPERDEMVKIMPLLSADPEAAAAALRKLATPQASAIFDFTLGNVAFQLGRFDEAEAAYRSAAQKFPSFRRAHKNLGLIYVRTGRFDLAMTSLGRVIELGGADGLTYGLLGYACNATQHYLSAESALRQAILLQPDVLDWRMGLVQSLMKQQRLGEASALLEELLAHHPDRAELWLLQANAYLGLGKPLQAAEDYEVVERLGKGTLATNSALGDIYTNEGLYEMAAAAYLRALALDPTGDADRHIRNAEVLAQRGAMAQARAILDQIEKTRTGELALDETERRRLLKIEARMAMASGTGDEAVPVLEEIVSLDPLDGDALLLLGEHYARSGDQERAVFYYERAESVTAVEAEARIRHAQILVGQGKYAEAVPLLKRAQELKPRDEVARYLEQVERTARSH